MKIKSKKVIQTEESVYDITVSETHNFLLESGVFAHNCDHPDKVIGGWDASNAGITVPGSKDLSDACTHIVYSAFTHPVQTNIMDLASSITKVERVAPNGQQIKPAYYNSGKRVMSQRDATALAMKMFNR